MTSTLTGQVERVTFYNPENGFAVLKVRIRDQEELVAVIGKVLGVTAGEWLEANGEWVWNATHGRQFQAEHIATRTPETVEGIRFYLASGAIRGIGPKLAERIVNLFGEKTLHILDHYPEMLSSIPGIGRQTVARIKSSWQEHRSVRSIMIFLGQHGIGIARSVRIYRLYGDRAIPLIKENPYRLAEEIRGIGFQTADALARSLGIALDSPFRIRSGILHVLKKQTTEGHCAVPQSPAVRFVSELLQVEEGAVEAELGHLLEARSLIRENIEGEPWLFLPPLHAAEIAIARELRRLMFRRHPLRGRDLTQQIQQVASSLQLELAPAQEAALQMATEQKVMILTGGPGVGKTTIVKALLELFECCGLRTVLAAPTGRAAKRLEETSGREARTIHRLLEFDPISGRFQREESKPLEGDLFVLDEVSMLDVRLAEAYFRALPDESCVVLVGDSDQLPSVGPGNLLSDMMKSQLVPLVRLTEIFRQQSHSRIIQAARAIHDGELPDLETPADGLSDFYFIECEEPEAIERMIVKLVTERIPTRFGLNPLTDIQVLTPMNRTPLGARNLNQVLQKALNGSPTRTSVERFGWTFQEGDRVIQTENNYQQRVFNGDLGLIEKIHTEEQLLTVNFDGRPVPYDFTLLDELALAYALTVHKSQGSEYPCVIMPLHTQHFLMLQRNLLYTGVTRGRRLVVLVGKRMALEMAVSRFEVQQRWTTLQRRLSEQWKFPQTDLSGSDEGL